MKHYNLIVGYNELGNPNGDDCTGSHNVSFGSLSDECVVGACADVDDS